MIARRETLQYLGRTPDHNDKIEEGALSDAFEHTAHAWKTRFGVPYSVCGCGPESSTMREKISSIFHHHSKAERAVPLEQLNTREDICSTSREDALITHPSEHNSVQLPKHSISVAHRLERDQKLLKHEKEIQKEFGKGTFKDEWERLLIERDVMRGQHPRAFFAPMYLGSSVALQYR
jgi:hypothetical protein